MKIFAEWPIHDDIKIVMVDKIPEELYLQQINKYLLTAHPPLGWREHIGEVRLSQLKALRERTRTRYELRLVLFDGEDMIGWSYGWQDGCHHGDFYMAASLVLPAYRKQGLYTKLVYKILEETKKEGFSAVRSRHIITNNPVLIAKLKMGFTICGMEQDEAMGSLLRMVYYHDDIRKKAAEFRAGKLSLGSVFRVHYQESTQ